MRIAQLVTRLNVGGISSYVLALTRQLAEEGHDVWLLSGTSDAAEGDMLRFEPELGSVRHVRIPSLTRSIRPGADLAALRAIFGELRAIGPDIVHSHMSKAGALGRTCGLAARVPVRIHSLHGTVFQGHFSTAAARAFALTERALATTTATILVDSEAVRRELLRWAIAPDRKIRVLPLGFRLERFGDAAASIGAEVRAAVGAQPGTPVVTLVARLVPVKAVDVFLEAAALVARLRPHARFAIVGDGELRGWVEREIASRGMAANVRLLGFWPDLREIYAASDIVALSSWSEGTPVALIEAMAAGCPVVATAVGGVPDVVADGVSGFLVPAGDGRQLGERLLRLIDDPALRAAMGGAGRAGAERFTIEGSSQATAAVYRELLAELG